MWLWKCKDGVTPWKTVTLLRLVLSLAITPYSQCLMDMEVSKCNCGNNFCPGQEVALFVKKHFADELVKLTSYKSKQYKQAFEEVFMKIDELLLTK